MTLFKRGNGIYYVVLRDSEGKRRWISTNEKIKSKALKKLVEFKDDSKQPSVRLKLSEFKREFLSYATSVFSSGTVDIYTKSLEAFRRHAVDMNLSLI